MTSSCALGHTDATQKTQNVVEVTQMFLLCTCFVDSLDIHASTKHAAPPLMEIHRYGKHSDAIKIYDGIIFNFDMGLAIMLPNRFS